MNDSLRQALGDVLGFLGDLQRDGTRPREARNLLQAVRGRHPELGIDLLAEEQAFDQSVHYDALLRRAGEGTVSLSYCPERAVPWPLRGVHRWDEGDLVSVNAHVLTVDQAMACLDFIWDEAPIIERLIHMVLVQEELDREPIVLSDAELQEAMNRFRAAKKLFKAEDTLRWLERHGMSQEKLERYVADQTLVARLRERIAGGRVEEYFQQHAGDFDTVSIARFEVADEALASVLAAKIRAGQMDFFAAAADAFLTRIGHAAADTAALFSVVERRHAAAELREPLFAAAEDDLVGPVRSEKGFSLIRVLETNPAVLDDRTRTAIKKILFKNWLEERRQASKIEWCWGNASKTG